MCLRTPSNRCFRGIRGASNLRCSLGSLGLSLRSLSSFYALAVRLTNNSNKFGKFCLLEVYVRGKELDILLYEGVKMRFFSLLKIFISIVENANL